MNKNKTSTKPPEPTGGVFPHRTEEPRCVHPPRLRHDLALRPGLRVVGNVGDAWWFGWIRGGNQQQLPRLRFGWWVFGWKVWLRFFGSRFFCVPTPKKRLVPDLPVP